MRRELAELIQTVIVGFFAAAVTIYVGLTILTLAWER